KLASNNELGGVFFNMVGVMYAIILAFMVFAVWDQYQSASHTAEDEATTLGNVFRDSTVFPGAESARLRAELRNYGQLIVDREWPEMAQRQESKQVSDEFNRVWATFVQLDPVSEQQKAFYSEMTHNINQLHALRHSRLLASTSSLPRLL